MLLIAASTHAAGIDPQKRVFDLEALDGEERLVVWPAAVLAVRDVVALSSKLMMRRPSS